jgi:hypothetical protein
MRALARTKRLALGTSICCLLAVLAIWRIRAAWTERDIAFVASASRLPLPDRPRDAVSYDNGQFAILVSIDLSPSERDAILRTGQFHRAAHGATRVAPQSPSDFRSINRLPPSVRVIQGAGDLYHGGGCSTHQSWTALLDKSSSRIWIEVLYPDWGGDDPGCLFLNMERFSSTMDGVQAP